MRDLLLYNGRFLTMAGAAPRASVLACRGGRVAYVGDDAQAAAAALGPGALKIDLGGCLALPGFADSHAHVFSEGQRLRELNLHHLPKEAIVAAVRQAAAAKPEGVWIRGYGWNQEEWPGQAWPTKEDLDAAAPNHCVALDRTDKHSIWANSRALAAAGLTDDTPDPHGGEYLRDAGGHLTGLVVGWAMEPLWHAFPTLSDGEMRHNLLAAQREYFSFGLTSAMNAGTVARDIEVLMKAYGDGELKMRLQAMLLAGEKADEIYFASGGGLARGLFDGRLAIDGVKIHGDGSLGSRSAWMLADYHDRPGHRGHHNFTDGEMLAILERARDHGFQVSVHAIGDAAVHQVVSCMRQVLGRRPMDHRWRVEHYQVADPADTALALKMGLIFSIQTVGLMTDLGMADERLGPGRVGRSYTWRDILDGGGLIVNGSDGPVETVNPYHGFYAAVTRRNLEGLPPGGWRPAHCLTREEALKSYTVWPAYAAFAEKERGRLAAGFRADVNVVDRDIMACPAEGIKDAKTVLTVCGGEVVYDAR